MGNARGLAASDVRHVEFSSIHAEYDFDVFFRYEFGYPLLINGERVEGRDVTFCFVTENHQNGDKTTATGMAVLHPGEDFSRPAGRQTALDKVLVQSLNLTDWEKGRFKEVLAAVEDAGISK